MKGRVFMSFDGISLKNVLFELNNNLINARVEKVYVPTKNDIFINFHTQNRENLKLLISIDANNARVHFSNNVKENPSKAPQICMILRKHLQGAKLLSVKQVGLDRIIIFTFQNLNEFGDNVERKLIVELMGKYSNAILANDNNKIIDSMRHVDITMSSVREVLPNKDYIFPSTLGKLDFIKTDFNLFKEKIFEQGADTQLFIAISNIFIGFSRSYASSIVNDDYLLFSNCDEHLKNIYDKISCFLLALNDSCFKFKYTENGKDYFVSGEKTATNSLEASYFLDDFYSKKESISLLKVNKLNIERDIRGHLNKLNKKLYSVNEILKDEENLEKYKQYGELLTCNMHKLTLGMDSVCLENFYDNCNIVEIPLQKNISPSRNAQIYFKKYTKLKNSISHAKSYKIEFEENIDYLNSVLYELEIASSLEELDYIKEELANGGYIKKVYKSNKKRDDLPSEPIKYEFNGVEILVGRNNLQNDKLTLKMAKKSYTWLHTKRIHGSHVIIKSDEVSDELLYYAATLAVKHSQGKNSSKVEVDYTLVKNVHKEIGAKPGMVIYTNYHTIIV